MSKITPLMTSLHEGHKTEERLQCIDDMLIACEDTKYTILQAFLWYRKHSIPLDRVKQAREEMENEVFESLADDGSDWFTADKVSECMTILDKLIENEDKE